MIAIGSYFVFIMFVLGTVYGFPDLSPDKVEQFFKEIVKEHNKYRMLHGASDLALDKSVSKLARKALVPYALNGYKNAQGFNYSKKPFLTSSKLNESLAKEIVADWYNTGANYDYHKEPTSNIADPFTGIIWKATERLGAAFTWNENILYVVVGYSGESNKKGYKYYINNVEKLLNAQGK